MSGQRRTWGSLNAGDVGKQAQLNDAGFSITGTIKYVWHSATYKGEPQTRLELAVGGGEVKLVRPAHEELMVFDPEPEATDE